MLALARVVTVAMNSRRMDAAAKVKLWTKTLDAYCKTLAKGFAVAPGAPNKHWRAPTIDGAEAPLVSVITIGWDHGFGCYFYARDPRDRFIDYHSRIKLPPPVAEAKLASEEELRAVADACAALASFRALPRSDDGVRLVSHQEQGAGPRLDAVMV